MYRLPIIGRQGDRWVRGAILSAFVVLAGCSQFIPDFGLRDDYMGKSILQSDEVPKPVAHDGEGEAELKQ